MCGRYLLYSSKMDYENALAKAGELAIDRERSLFEIPPDYNVTPSKAGWIASNDGKNAWLDR